MHLQKHSVEALAAPARNPGKRRRINVKIGIRNNTVVTYSTGNNLIGMNPGMQSVYTRVGSRNHNAPGAQNSQKDAVDLCESKVDVCGR
jgi:hypothetical protein